MSTRLPRAGLLAFAFVDWIESSPDAQLSGDCLHAAFAALDGLVKQRLAELHASAFAAETERDNLGYYA